MEEYFLEQESRDLVIYQLVLLLLITYTHQVVDVTARVCEPSVYTAGM